MTTNERTPPKRGSTRRPGGMQLQGSPAVGHLANLSASLDLRERLVEVLDALDRDDLEGARFYAEGLLDDLDATATLAPTSDERLMSRRRSRRLLPPPPPHELYRRAAVLERRACELARERQSQRILMLGKEIARGVERIADEELAA